MAKHLLVPFDGSDQARGALAYALGEYPDATITTLHVVNPAEWGYGSTESGLGKRWYEEAHEESEQVRAEATELADEHGRTVRTATEDGHRGRRAWRDDRRVRRGPRCRSRRYRKPRSIGPETTPARERGRDGRAGRPGAGHDRRVSGDDTDNVTPDGAAQHHPSPVGSAGDVSGLVGRSSARSGSLYARGATSLGASG